MYQDKNYRKPEQILKFFKSATEEILQGRLEGLWQMADFFDPGRSEIRLHKLHGRVTDHQYCTLAIAARFLLHLNDILGKDSTLPKDVYEEISPSLQKIGIGLARFVNEGFKNGHDFISLMEAEVVLAEMVNRIEKIYLG